MYEGEKTLLVTRPTRLISLRYYASMVLALILAGALYFRVIQAFVPSFPDPSFGGYALSTLLATFLAFLALLAFLAGELTRKTTRYIITDNKVIREDGILNKNTKMAPYTQLERVDLSQTLVQRILKIGTIVIDTGDDSLTIDMVRNPRQVQDLLSNRIGRRAYTDQAGPPR